MKTSRNMQEIMKRYAFGLGALGLMGLVAETTFAQSWVPAGGGTWNDIASWNPGTIPDSVTAQVSFSKNFTNAPALPVFTLDSATPFTVNKITYNDTTATYYGATIAPGSPAGSLIFAGTTPTIDTPAASANAADLTITAPVDLTLGLTKTGARNVFLNGAVTGFGPLVYNNVNGGTLAIGSATPIDWTTINKATGGGTLRLDALSTMTAPATLSVSSGELFLNPASGSFSFNAAGFTKLGNGTLRLAKAATGAGGSAVLIVSGGYLALSDTISNFASGTVSSGASLQPNAATYGNIPLTITGSGPSGSQGALFFRSGGNTTVTWPGAITLGSGGAAIGSYGVTYNTTLSGAISGTGPLLLQALGGSESSHTATFTLTANSTYNGDTTFKNNAGIKEAKLKLGVNNALPITTALMLSMAAATPPVGVTLDLNGKSQQLTGLSKDTVGASSKYRILNSSATASTLIVSNNTANAFDGLIGITANANLSLIKQGSAILTLSGTNVYSGGTTINAGTLLVNNATGSGTGTGNVTVDSGATLGGNGTISGPVTAAAGATLKPGGSGTLGTLTLSNTLALTESTLVFDLSSTGPTNDILVLKGAAAAGALTLNGSNILKINLLTSTLPAGVYTLMTYSSTNGAGSLSLENGYRNTTLTVGNTSMTLTVAGSGISGTNLTWVGDGSGNAWDMGTSPLWSNGATPDLYYNSDDVIFSDTGSASPDINLTTAVQPVSVTVTNVTKDYTFAGAGSLDGVMSLSKRGSGTLTLATANTYSGTTDINGGVLALSGGSDRLSSASPLRFTGTGALNLGGNSATAASLAMTNNSAAASVISNGTLTLNGAVTVGATVASLSNSLDLRKTSGLTVNASAANMSVGGTDVSATANSGGELYLSAANATLKVNQVQVGRVGPGAASGTKNTGKLHLGQDTVIQADQLLLGTTRGEGTIDLQAGLAAPTVSLRNTSGSASRVTLVQVGENGAGGTTTGFGLLDVRGATLDGLVNQMIIGRGASVSSTPVVTGDFKMDAGLLDVISLSLCKNEGGGLNANNGTFTQNGGIVKVQSLTMGSSLAGSYSASPVLRPTYYLGTNATLYAQTIAVGTGFFGDTSIRKINMSSATLRNYDGSTDLSVSGRAGNGGAGTGGTLDLILAAATTNRFHADTDRTITLSTTAVISGSGALEKTGAGMLTLSGTNTFSGATLISAGTLRLTQSQSLNTNTVLVIDGGATLELQSGVSQTVTSLTLDGKLWRRGDCTWGASGSGAQYTSPQFSGTGVLHVLGPAPLGTVLRLF